MLRSETLKQIYVELNNRIKCSFLALNNYIQYTVDSARSQSLLFAHKSIAFSAVWIIKLVLPKFDPQ